MDHTYGQAQVSSDEIRKREAEKRAMLYAREKSEADWEQKDAAQPSTPRVHIEAEMLAKSISQLSDKVIQLEEKLGCVLRPLSPAIAMNKDAPEVKESVCVVAEQFRGSREQVEEVCNRVRRLVSLLEI